MAGEWAHHKVGDLFELVPGFAFKSEDFKTTGAPVIKIKNVKANAIVLDDLGYVDLSFLESKEDKVLQHGDILITMSGNRFGSSKDTWVGKVAYFRYPGKYLLNQRVGILRPKRSVEMDRRCCSYILGSDEYQHLFIAIATSSGGQANLSPNQILGADILLPPIEEQRAIAHILGTLDDKIELNRRMNETLEAIARAIFKSWFADFDPVRAKMAGRWKKGESTPGLPAELWDLFPDSFEDSELGEIPRGWEVQRLGDLIELAYGKALKAENRRAGSIPVFGSNGQIGWHDQKLIDGPGIIVGRKGNPGVVTWAPTDFFAIDTTFYVVPKTECASLHFLYYALLWHDLASLGADSAVPGLNRNLAYMNLQTSPQSTVLDAFDRQVKPLFDRTYANERESRTLAALRDTLLPKLISGELRVQDAGLLIGGQT